MNTQKHILDNILIYRAKKIDNDGYVEGAFDGEYKILTNYNRTVLTRNKSVSAYNYEIIDLSTLAIHFPDMLDSEGTKIFASLSEDGKGGDEVAKDSIGYRKNTLEKGDVVFRNGNTYIQYSKHDKELLSSVISNNGNTVMRNIKVIGIQE